MNAIDHRHSACGTAATVTCRNCGAPVTRTFVDLGMSPLVQSFVRADKLDTMEPFYPLNVLICDGCKLVQLRDYVSPDSIFTEYAYFSSYSETWLAHARAHVETMAARLDLGQVVRDEQRHAGRRRGPAARARGRDEAQQRALARGVQPRRRLVQQHEARVAHERARERGLDRTHGALAVGGAAAVLLGMLARAWVGGCACLGVSDTHTHTHTYTPCDTTLV